MEKQEEARIQRFEISDFAFLDGTTLPLVQLAYLDIRPHASKVAVVHTHFRGRLSTTPSYSGGALGKHRIIAIALFGNGESSSPSNTPDFPHSVDYIDCVNAQHRLLAHLGIHSVDVMLGFSMGGQATYHWLARHNDFVQKAVIICSSARTSRHNYQFLEGPKAGLENAVDFADGRSRSGEHIPRRGLRAFGKAYSAWLTSAEWFEQALYKQLGYETLADWDKEVAGTNYDNWHPEDLLSMLRTWQRGDISTCISSHNGSLSDSLSQIRARVLLMPCQTDQYFRWEASEQEAARLQRAELKVIPSVWGHLAGLGINKADVEWINGRIAKFLDCQD